MDLDVLAFVDECIGASHRVLADPYRDVQQVARRRIPPGPGSLADNSFEHNGWSTSVARLTIHEGVRERLCCGDSRYTLVGVHDSDRRRARAHRRWRWGCRFGARLMSRWRCQAGGQDKHKGEVFRYSAPPPWRERTPVFPGVKCPVAASAALSTAQMVTLRGALSASCAPRILNIPPTAHSGIAPFGGVSWRSKRRPAPIPLSAAWRRC
jgi:hypothetical protein